MALQNAPEAAERIEMLLVKKAPLCQHSIERGHAMPLAQHEAIALGPARVVGTHVKPVEVKQSDHFNHAHQRAVVQPDAGVMPHLDDLFAHLYGFQHQVTDEGTIAFGCEWCFEGGSVPCHLYLPQDKNSASSLTSILRPEACFDR